MGKRRLESSAVADIICAFRWRQQTLREFKANGEKRYGPVNDRRIAALADIQHLCAVHRISSRDFYRYARGVYKGRR